MRDYGLRETNCFRVGRVGVWISPVIVIKEGMCYMDLWVLYANNES